MPRMTDATLLQRNLDRIRKERGLSMRDLSLRAGLNETAVKAIMGGKSESPREHTIRALAAVLDCSIEDLVGNPEEPALSAISRMLPSRRNAAYAAPPSQPEGAPLAPAAVQLPFPGNMPWDLPVHGTAQGGPDGAFELVEATDLPVDRVRRPPGLAGMRNVFALYTVGDSMSPWREPGDLIFVHPDRPPAIGSYVVLVFRPTERGGSRSAMIKRLVRRTPTKVMVEQYNPRKTLEFDASTIEHMWRVIDWQEAMGFG